MVCVFWFLLGVCARKGEKTGEVLIIIHGEKQKSSMKEKSPKEDGYTKDGYGPSPRGEEEELPG